MMDRRLQVMFLLVSLSLRAYTHYIAQYLVLEWNQIPIGRFDMNRVSCARDNTPPPSFFAASHRRFTASHRPFIGRWAVC